MSDTEGDTQFEAAGRLNFDAYDWLNWELADAERKVERCRFDVESTKRKLRMDEAWLNQAIVKADAIRLVISRSYLEGSAKPADTTEGGK